MFKHKVTILLIMSYLSITSVNCRVQNVSKKKKDDFFYLRDLNSFIYYFQDTLCKENKKSSLYAKWVHDILIGTGRADARGTLICKS